MSLSIHSNINIGRDYIHWFEHIGLSLCQFFHHIFKCFELFPMRWWTLWAQSLCLWSYKHSSTHSGTSSYVVKCISSCKASDHPDNFNRKVIYWKDTGWLIEMIENLEKNGWEKGRNWGRFGVHVTERSQLFTGPHCWPNEIQTFLFPFTKI